MTRRTASKLDWFDRVARWRAAAPKQRFAQPSEQTTYYFRLARFTHQVTAKTLCQMNGPVYGRGRRPFKFESIT